MTTTALLLGGVVTLVAVLVAATYCRRRLIARGEALLLCAERVHGDARWHLRLARYDAVSLELYRANGFSLTPVRRLVRGLDGLHGARACVDGAPPVLVEPVVLRCAAPDGLVDLAVGAADYTAVRSWFESSPPGIVRSVA